MSRPYPIKIYEKYTMVWSVFDGDEWHEMSGFIAAWVTPHATEIDPLVRQAAEYHPDKSMNVYQCGGSCTDDEGERYTNALVKALFMALKKGHQICYINPAFTYGKTSDKPQRVRLPKEDLATKICQRYRWRSPVCTGP
ncbi:MAG: hypothetical protein NTV68_05395 [Methanomicrobiales archaeon]|nr:hypothetical protein [Methanomicrobiales archaeon]